MGFVRTVAIIFFILLVIYGLYYFASNNIEKFPESFTINFFAPIIFMDSCSSIIFLYYL